MTAAVMEAEPRASLQDWLAVLAGALGALLASLDISIVNSALPQLQGEIGATGTEGTWISTGYLVAEVIMIPLTAWLSRTFGMRNLLLCCAVAFTLFSMLCGVSHTLPMMIIGRMGQGFFGGALIPAAQILSRTRLPPSQMPVGMTIFGLIVLLGPLVGPMFGGWLTENISWRWCFFINLPIAVGLVSLLLLGLPSERVHLGDFIKADWLGIAGLALALGPLTIVLEEGQRVRWFESQMIDWLAVVSVVGFVLIAISQVTTRRPVLKLKLMLNRSYAAVIIIVVTVAMALYGIMYVIPQFLVLIVGDNAEQSGEVLFISGIPAFLLMPFLPRMLRLNIRIMVQVGLVFFAASCLLDAHLTADTGSGDFVLSQLLRGAGQILAFMPLNQASVGAVSLEDTPDAAGLYNMARNLGGSLGLAMLGVFVDRQSNTHAQAIGELITANSQFGQSQLAAQAATLAPHVGGLAQGQAESLAMLAATVQQQAMIMTYSDCFFLMGGAMIIMLPLAFLLRTPALRNAPSSGH